jgi:regulator of sigma E protease
VNINLAVFNLLPIPVLDGGHMLFATIGKLRGRPLPHEFIAAAQSVFMVLLFSMIIYVTFFDVRRWNREARPERPEQTAPAK